MDLSTTYLGLRLPHPLMPGACQALSSDLDTVRRLEDAGAAAIVMHSLFEEQIEQEARGVIDHVDAHGESFQEALSFFPTPAEYVFGPDRYLEELRRIKQAVAVPVIASLNGVTPAGWLDHARLFEQAGADAIELNVYYVATDPAETSEHVERRVLDIARMVRSEISIAVAVKLSPFFSSFPHLARSLDEVGVDGLILFNRFYQPDIDPEALEIVPHLRLSDSSELLLRLRWLAMLSGRVRASLAATGGIHTGLDAIKAVMAGAHAAQIVSAVLLRGPACLAAMREEMVRWMEEHEYDSLAQMRGSMSLERCPNPAALERANYVRLLHSWRP
jgi:dihydroorotate dehydrogenase (fumarate)